MLKILAKEVKPPNPRMRMDMRMKLNNKLQQEHHPEEHEITATPFQSRPSMYHDAVQIITDLLLGLSAPSILLVIFNHLVHKADIIKLLRITIFKHIWPMMLRHRLDQVFDNFVGDQRVSQIHFSDIRLRALLANDLHRSCD